jgi:hypothetical protein
MRNATDRSLFSLEGRRPRLEIRSSPAGKLEMTSVPQVRRGGRMRVRSVLIRSEISC